MTVRSCFCGCIWNLSKVSVHFPVLFRYFFMWMWSFSLHGFCWFFFIYFHFWMHIHTCIYHFFPFKIASFVCIWWMYMVEVSYSVNFYHQVETWLKFVKCLKQNTKKFVLPRFFLLTLEEFMTECRCIFFFFFLRTP